MQQWMPDLARAARLRMHMGGLARQAALGFTALDNLPQGIALVDSNCRIHYCNPSADCLLAAFAKPCLCATACCAALTGRPRRNCYILWPRLAAIMHRAWPGRCA